MGKIFGLLLLSVSLKAEDSALNAMNNPKKSNLLISYVDPKNKTARERFEKYRKYYEPKKIRLDYERGVEINIMGRAGQPISVKTLEKPKVKSLLFYRIKQLMIKLKELFRELSRIGIWTQYLIKLANEIEELIQQIESILSASTYFEDIY